MAGPGADADSVVWLGGLTRGMGLSAGMRERKPALGHGAVCPRRQLQADTTTS